MYKMTLGFFKYCFFYGMENTFYIFKKYLSICV